MSPISIGLDLLLVTLLLTALYVGLRLNGRLKALREGQAGFIKAVADLDVAAGRAESGLQALRIASENTHDELLTRIETARGLIARLEKANAAAASLTEASADAAPPTVFATMPRFEGRPQAAAPARPTPSRPVPSRPAIRGFDEDLFETESAPALQRRLGERP